MQIRVKTAEEFRDAHVTIEIVANDQAQVGPLYSAAMDAERELSEAEKRIAQLERDARMTAVTVDSLRKQLADETKRANRVRVVKVHSNELDEHETAVRELRQVVTHLHQELDRAADNFKISQDKNRDLKAELDQVRSDRDIQKKERTANREWAERAEKHLLDARVKLKKISKAVNDGLTISTQKVEEIREILDEA